MFEQRAGLDVAVPLAYSIAFTGPGVVVQLQHSQWHVTQQVEALSPSYRCLETHSLEGTSDGLRVERIPTYLQPRL